MAWIKEKVTTAIDISDGFARLVAVSSDKTGKYLFVMDSVRVPSDDEKEVAKAVRALLWKHRLMKTTVIASFPRHLVTIRNIQLPTVKDEEIADMAELQAIKFLPYSAEEIATSYKLIEITKEGYADILLVLSQRRLVTRYMSIFDSVGVRIEKLALASEGILAWYSSQQFGYKAPIALIDFDAYHTRILIVRDGKLMFSRSVSFDVLNPHSDKEALLREIRLSFDSYAKDTSGKVSRMILCGSENFPADFSAFVAGKIDIPCQQIRQLRSITARHGAQKFAREVSSMSYTHLLGHACYPDALQINLLPRSVIAQRKESFFKRELVRIGILSLAIIVALFGITEKKMRQKRLYLRRIEARLKQIGPEVSELLKLKENNEVIQNQLSAEGSSIDILREVYRILPADISLALLEYEDGNRVLLRGTAKELSAVFALLPQLEKSPYFTKVKINYATKRTFKHREYADFEIICSLSQS